MTVQEAKQALDKVISKIQSIITEKDLRVWYEKALRGRFASEIGDQVLALVKDEILLEFPVSGGDDFNEFKKNRDYDSLILEGLWGTDIVDNR